jgi:6-pyruvoyltetrahydropterin/6-carboxytetrahydropterin synthase
VDDYVVEPFDHTFLNKDIPYFAEVVPTAENIAVHIRDLLQEPIRAIGSQLHKVKLIESPNNSCEVYALDAEIAPAVTQIPEPAFVRA